MTCETTHLITIAGDLGAIYGRNTFMGVRAPLPTRTKRVRMFAKRIREFMHISFRLRHIRFYYSLLCILLIAVRCRHRRHRPRVAHILDIHKYMREDETSNCFFCIQFIFVRKSFFASFCLCVVIVVIHRTQHWPDRCSCR